jgi:flagellar biogenesis protein FliO
MRDRVFALVALCAPAVANADATAPSFEVRGRDEAVEIIAHDVEASHATVSALRSRLEIPLVGHPIMARVLPTDATVKIVELDHDDAKTSLSIKLGFEHADVVTLARYAKAIQVGSDLHVLLPRHVPAEGANVVLPGPTLPLVAPAPVAAPAAPAAIAPPAASPPRADAGSAAPSAAPTPAPASLTTQPNAAPNAAVNDSPIAMPAPTKATATTTAKPTLTEESTFGLSTYIALGLAAVGTGVWLLRRKRAQPITTSIDVIAQRSLGGKARVVWLSANGRELLVAVTAQNVSVLDTWRKDTQLGSVPGQLPAAALLPVAQARLERAEPNASPAIAGLLKLREKTMPPPAIDESVASDDPIADSMWMNEIVAATRGRR